MMLPALAQPVDLPLTPDLRGAYLRLIEDHFGLQLSGVQAASLDDVIRQLLVVTRYPSAHSLYAALAAGAAADLWEALGAQLTVGETHFFRVAPHIEALQRVVLPDLIGRRADRRRLAIWSAGCSTGEEPYTVAILLHEHLSRPEAWEIQLLGSDISQPALASAREAIYGEWSFRATPDQIRYRYFTPDGRRWRLIESVRRMARFVHLNLAADPFPSPDANGPNLDLVLCRNVTIYFAPQAAQRLYQRLAESLADGGWLVLGPSDPPPQQPGPLVPHHLPDAVLWRRAQPAGPTTARPGRPGPPRPVRATPAGPAPIPRPLRRGDLPAAQPVSTIAEQALALARRGDLVAAHAKAVRLTEEQPLEVEAHLLAGLLALDAGLLQPALDSLRRATFLDPGQALAQFSLGRAYWQLGDTTRARATLTHARRLVAAAPGEQVVSSGAGFIEGVTMEELRQAVDAQLAQLRNEPC